MGFIKQWLPYILAGISAGGQYALIAVGYTMVYGILRLINFAHGDIFMVAGLIMVYLSASMPLYVSIPAVVVLTVALGFAIERCAYKPLRQAPRMSVMISAIGVRNVVENKVDFTNTRNVIVAALILVLAIGISYSGSIQIGIVSLSGLAVASIVGIGLNAILPGKDYVFEQEDEGSTSVDLSGAVNMENK